MRNAVVGAGISGLVAHLLHPEHEVTLFEANGYARGHTNTIRVDTPNETHQVDSGFIVFNDRNYPNIERLLRRLGVAWQPLTMSFSVSDGVGDFEYSSGSPNGLFAKRAQFFDNHRMLSFRGRPRWRTVRGGSARYIGGLDAVLLAPAAAAYPRAGGDPPSRSRPRAAAGRRGGAVRSGC